MIKKIVARLKGKPFPKKRLFNGAVEIFKLSQKRLWLKLVTKTSLIFPVNSQRELMGIYFFTGVGAGFDRDLVDPELPVEFYIQESKRQPLLFQEGESHLRVVAPVIFQEPAFLSADLVELEWTLDMYLDRKGIYDYARARRFRGI